ncbi:uncharacterized protein (TIGR02680 family) [Paenibacillus cellulosilyticus]|uniref:Uncharacterized protein (TIGR02680 family) n=1 Tax=Paenibacillus cellulosilyticus TaxID=375489 RepID=A0A2V2YPB0_9BACL|nr:TIGR02680 family protein [Paenibacillus cellulosilyticus]PWV94547.1 uncharacterized protein (TIGR02680 family) [Paenibacillus cellulosilyticus]
MRFHPNRLGFFNFWYHTDSEFEFSKGKLFIRGKNGSGKTITTTMGVPVLIDGNKRANRLDPMGSRDRHMVDLLLGEESISGHKDRIGYLYFEYKNGNQYITTGIGMHGFRDTGRLNSWYFILSDGRRIGRQVRLFDEEWVGGNLQKVVKNKPAMREALGPHTFFTESQEEYMEEVSRRLFGFPDVKMFRDLVELLLNLRSPKLSRDLKPGVVNEILSTSLQELTEKELDPLTESIDIIDKHEVRLQKTKQEIEILTTLCNVNDIYKGYIAYTVARETKQVQENEKAIRTSINNSNDEIRKFKRSMEDAAAEVTQMRAERDSLNQQKQGLVTNSLFDKLQTNQTRMTESEDKLEILKERISNKRSQYIEAKNRCETEVGNLSNTRKNIHDLIVELSENAEEIYFSEHERQAKLFESSRDDETYPFTVWNDLIKEYSTEITEIKEGFVELAQLAFVERTKRDEKETALEALESNKEALNRLDELFENLRAEFLTLVLSWAEDTKALQVMEQEKSMLRLAVDQLYRDEENLIALEKWKNVVQERRLQSVKDRIFLMNKELESARKELQYASDKKRNLVELGEVSPELTPGQEEHSEQLRNANIPHGRFYELVEFKEYVPEQVRQALESSITQVGLIHSIIVNPQDDEKARKLAVITQVRTRKVHNLSNYLSPVSTKGVHEETIRSVLEGISVATHEEGYILEDGGFSGGWSLGSAAKLSYYYVGREARVRLRDVLLGELDEIITVCNERILSCEEGIRELEIEKRKIIFAASQMPIPTKVKECYGDIKETETSFIVSQKTFDARSDEYDKAEKKYTQFKQTIRERTRQYPFGMDEDAYGHVLKRCGDYIGALTDLRVEREKLTSLAAAVSRAKEVYEMVRRSLEETQEEIGTEEANISNANLTIALIKEQLKNEGLQDISDQIEAIDKRMDVLSESIITASNLEVTAKTLKEQKEKNKQENLTRLLGLEKLVRAWEKKFQEEQRSATIPSDWSPEETVISMEETYHKLQRTDLEIALNEQFYGAQHDLHDYKPDLHKVEGADIGEEMDEGWLALREKTTRLILTFTVDYKKITPNTLLLERKQQRLNDEQLIEAEEKELYKKVLIDDIGTTVVQRIQSARDWTVSINEMLGNMSTNIKIQLRWDALPRKLGSLSTKQLVDILSRDSEWIIDEDIARVSKHFRSQIEDARSLAKSDKHLSLRDKIREVMDYRKWFVFTIRSQKGDEVGFSDLTDTVFNTYSNGEKAMSIYMPLFAAIAAKYKDASSTAPRVISLDEAFAGVDADNTAQLFQLAHQLDFDYIMNAFGLWGCYESVDKLSIIEIVRPISSSTLGLVKYHWDGKKRYRFPTGESLETNPEPMV